MGRTNLGRIAAIALPGVALLALAARSASAAAGLEVSQGGLHAWVPDSQFRGALELFSTGRWETVSPDRLPLAADRAPVLGSASVLAAADAEKRAVVLYTRQESQLARRGEVCFDLAPRWGGYKLVRDANAGRLGTEVYSSEDRLLFAFYLSPDGIIEFQPAAEKQLNLRGARWQYAVVPCLIGADFVYGPETSRHSDRLYFPPMGMVVGLVEGGQCMMSGVWPPDRQVAFLQATGAGGRRILDGVSLQTAGRSFHLAVVEKPGIWHAEPLKASYLERDTPIGWKRPFEAKWIGRLFVASEGVHYPFYFRHERVQLWGRSVRGWFYWPVWFDGDQTLVHFEKQFPPLGELLIYYLEKHPDRPDPAALLSPVEVMKKALGADETARLLDFSGIDERPLLPHGLSVCEMTAVLQKYFDAGQEVQHQAEIARYADDVVTFIRLIRQRINEFRQLAAQTAQLVKARTAAEPKLAGSAARLLAAIRDLEELYQTGMPPTSLEEVRQWTEQFNSLARQARPGNNRAFDAVAEKCRSVAGGQDDLVRDLNLAAIRLAQQAAQEAIHSADHARLAQEVIDRTRQVLRRPTVLEPRRYHALQVDPGQPD